MNVPAIDMGDCVAGMTLTITVTRSRAFRARMWMGLQVMKFGAAIVGFGTIKVESV